MNHQGAPIKKQSPRKTSVYQQWQYEFEPNIRTSYKSIHTTYPANFIKAADMVQQIQQLKTDTTDTTVEKVNVKVYFNVHFFK